MAIPGLSMAARAQAVVDRDEANRILGLLPLKYPENIALPIPMPTVISVLDYSKDFGHTELVTC